MRKNKTLIGILIGMGIFLLVYTASFAVSMVIEHLADKYEVARIIDGEKLRDNDYFSVDEFSGYIGKDYAYVEDVKLIENNSDKQGECVLEIPYKIKNKPVRFTSGAFYYLSAQRYALSEITVAADNPYYTVENGMLFNADKTKLLFCFGKDYSFTDKAVIPQGIEEIAPYAFAGGLYIDEVELPDTLRIIGDFAFDGCYLNSLYLPDSVTFIGNHAFENNDISELKLSSSLEEIGEYAFSGLRAESLELPSGVKTIGYRAFDSSYMKSANLPKSLSKIGDGVFSGCHNMEALYFDCPISALEDSSIRYYDLFEPSADYYGDRLEIYSSQPFYPLYLCRSLLCYKEVIVYEPCSSEGFAFSTGYEYVGADNGIDNGIEASFDNDKQAFNITKSGRDNATTVHFAFED